VDCEELRDPTIWKSDRWCFSLRVPSVPENVRITWHLTSIAATLLEAIMAYCNAFSNGIGHVCDATTIRLTVLTGVAASEIVGDTTSREFGLNKT
jgi:hypothetical protein